MSLSLSPRALGYVAVAGASLIAAVALQDVALAALGLPCLVAVIAGLAMDSAATEAEVRAEMSLAGEVVREGDSVRLTVRISASCPVARCCVSLAMPPTLRSDRPPYWLVALLANEATELVLDLTAGRAGEATIGPVELQLSGRGGILHRRLVAAAPVRLQVRPYEESLRSLPRSSRVRVAAGDRLAPTRGEGIELAEVRPELPGERAHRLNWRATARRGTPHVTLRHPEQSTDVVLFVDTFDSPELPRALELAATAAAGYLTRRDRVGLVAFGGVLDWVEAGSGRRQLERIRARLAATSPFFSYAWKTTERIPPRALPAGALVVAISPLRDERFTSALGEVRSRGHDVIVIELSPRPGPDGPTGSDTPSTKAARMLLRLEREDLRHRLWARGIAVAPLAASDPLELAFAQLNAVRRRIRPGARR